jgi:hypothetical protein
MGKLCSCISPTPRCFLCCIMLLRICIPTALYLNMCLDVAGGRGTSVRCFKSSCLILSFCCYSCVALLSQFYLPSVPPFFGIHLNKSLGMHCLDHIPHVLFSVLPLSIGWNELDNEVAGTADTFSGVSVCSGAQWSPGQQNTDRASEVARRSRARRGGEHRGCLA